MDRQFWSDRWQRGEINFHAESPNPQLVEHFAALALPPGSRVLVPLCGKTVDIAWLLAEGMEVVGVELVESAVEQLFEELGVDPVRTEAENSVHFEAAGLDVFAADVFDVTAETLGPIDATYDRAALVALPDEMRRRYVTHLLDISAGAPQLLLCFEYDPAMMPGPPFSITEEMVRDYYDDHYAIERLATDPVKLKGSEAQASVWHLRRR